MMSKVLNKLIEFAFMIALGYLILSVSLFIFEPK